MEYDYFGDAGPAVIVGVGDGAADTWQGFLGISEVNANAGSMSDVLRDIGAGNPTPATSIVNTSLSDRLRSGLVDEANGGSDRYLQLAGSLGSSAIAALGRVFGPGGAGTFATMPEQVRQMFTGPQGGLFGSPIFLLLLVVGAIFLLRRK